MIQSGAQFFVEELLWMLSWGWYQVLLGIFFMWLLHITLGHMKCISAFLLALASYASAMSLYFFIVVGVCVHYLQWQFAAGQLPHVFNPVCASLLLGLIYSCLQLFFYYVVQFWYHLPVGRFFMIALVANIAAALISSYFIKVVF